MSDDAALCYVCGTDCPDREDDSVQTVSLHSADGALSWCLCAVHGLQIRHYVDTLATAYPRPSHPDIL